MSMFDDVLGLGRSSVTESMMEDTLEPEIAGMTLEEAADIDEDPMDYMLRVAYENEMNMMNLDAAIVAEEYLYLRENGQEMVTEAGKLESIIEKARQMLQGLWAKIQSFFKSVLRQIEDKIALDERFCKKYENKVEGKYALVKGTEELMNFEAMKTRATKIMGNIHKIASDEVNNASKTQGDSYSDKDVFKKKLADAISEGKDENGDTTKAALRTIIKGYKGEKEAKPIRVSAKTALDSLRSAKNNKRQIQDAYAENKKDINGWLKDLKKLESTLKKFRVIPTEMSKNVHKSVKNLNMAGSALVLVNRTFIKAINMGRNFCKAAVVQGASRQSEDKDKSAASANQESASLIDSFELM